jgi:hypothetical protein
LTNDDASRLIVDRLAKLPTATLANALDDVGKVINSPVSIRPVAPAMAFCGPAA